MNFHKRSVGEKVFDVSNHVFLLIFTLLCFYPFYYIFLYSISDPTAADTEGIFLLPVKFSLATYKLLLSRSDIYNAIFISGSRVIVGTVFTIFCSSLFAYIVTKKELVFRKFFYRYVITTMYISAGLIPWYMTMKALGLKNNYLLYILPTGMAAFYIILIKTYIEQLPPSLEEAAKVEGAGYFAIFIKIIFPLCKPIIAAVAIFSAVGHWNAWQDNFYLVTNAKLTTLQLMLFNYLSTDAATGLASNMSGLDRITQVKSVITPMSIKMTMSMITVIPILIVYPALQKYFVKGIMIGAVKG